MISSLDTQSLLLLPLQQLGKSVTVKLHRDTLELLRDMGRSGDSVNDIIEKHFLKNASRRDTKEQRRARQKDTEAASQ